MIDVTPVIIPQVDWEALTYCLSRVVPNPSKLPDELGIIPKKQPIKAALMMLVDHTRIGLAPAKLPSLNPGILDSMGFGFHIAGYSDAPIWYYGVSYVPLPQETCLITGTLEVWYNTIANFQYEGNSQESRVILNKVFLLFEQLGLRELWDHYTKVSLPDTTFKLVPTYAATR